MNIIPHFLENEAKNLLKFKLRHIISNITDEFPSFAVSNEINIK